MVISLLLEYGGRLRGCIVMMVYLKDKILRFQPDGRKKYDNSDLWLTGPGGPSGGQDF